MSVKGRMGQIARTARHLKASQVFWRGFHEMRLGAYRRIPRLGAVIVRPDFEARTALLPSLSRVGLDSARAQLWREGFVEYLGVRAPRGDWRGKGQSRLWRYERQYHSELPGLAMCDVADASGFTNDWLAANPPCLGEAWEPYPVARRILNWTLACAVAPNLAPVLTPWLAAQMRFLASHLERHLLGNHLLCDLCAVVAAAAAVDAADSEMIAAEAATLLERELNEQVLPDGGYAERTAQYHVIVLHDALLALTLHEHRGRRMRIHSVLARMLEWVRRVRRDDGGFPWLNDAAPDAIPALDTVFGLAESAGLDAAPPSFSRSVVELPDTGWTIVREGRHELLFEHGIVGPEHQPGHGHADVLSYELVWGGTPVVVDSGVTTYDVGSVRAFERSAGAHATISVNGQGADEIWASFRVAGRSHPLYLGRSSPWPDSWLIRAQVRSYQGWLHRRGLIFSPGRCLIVCDEVSGSRSSDAIVSTIPLAPEWTIADGRLSSADLQLGMIVLKGTLSELGRGEYPIREGWVGCGFGRATARTTLAISAAEDGGLIYAIVGDQTGVSLHGDRLIVVSDGARREIPLDQVFP